MATLYASATDLAKLGLPQRVIDAAEAKAPGSRDAALAFAADWADSLLRGRYKLPLAAWGDDLRGHVAAIAARQLLTIVGFNPEVPADAIIATRAHAAERWLEGVARRVVHPNVTEAAGVAALPAVPIVLSDDARGWDD